MMIVNSSCQTRFALGKKITGQRREGENDGEREIDRRHAVNRERGALTGLHSHKQLCYRTPLCDIITVTSALVDGNRYYACARDL